MSVELHSDPLNGVKPPEAAFLALDAGEVERRVRDQLGLRRSPRREAAVAIVEAFALWPRFARQDLFHPRARLVQDFTERTLDRARARLIDVGLVEVLSDDVVQGGGQCYRVRLEALVH